MNAPRWTERHARIQQEVRHWRGGRLSGASDAPLLSPRAREVLESLLEQVHWPTREYVRSVEELRARAGYQNKHTIVRALKELEDLGLLVRQRGERAPVRLAFGNAKELRALLTDAAVRRGFPPPARRHG